MDVLDSIVEMINSERRARRDIIKNNCFRFALESIYYSIIAFDELKNGIKVSTVCSSDTGLETACVCNDGGVLIIERYSSLEEARARHLKWRDILEDGIGKKVVSLWPSGKRGPLGEVVTIK